MPRPQTLLIGPTPPPYGGATVSYQRFLDAISQSDKSFRHIQMPVFSSAADGPQRVSKRRTLCRLIGLGLTLWRYRQVVYFCSRGSAVSYAVVLAVCCRVLRRPFNLRLFGGYPFATLNRLPKPARALVVWSLKYCQTIAVQTDAAFASAPPGLRHRVVVIPGYRRLLMARNASEQSQFRLLFVGECSPAKGCDTLLQAYLEARKQIQSTDSLDSFQLHFFGRIAPTLNDQLKSASDQQVFAHGEVPHDQLCEQLGNFDCFVFPSRYSNEGHPGALIEALMVGLPVICSDLPTILEIVQHEQNGLVVPREDTDALTRAILRLRSNRELREKLAREARLTGESHDEEQVIPRLAAALGVDM